MKWVLVILFATILGLIIWSTSLNVAKAKMTNELHIAKNSIEDQEGVIRLKNLQLNIVVTEKLVTQKVLNNLMGELAKITGHRIDINKLIIDSIHSVTELKEEKDETDKPVERSNR